MPYSYAMMAADTVAAMDDAHVYVADIVGFSMRARIALELCLANPERVRTLTLIAGRPAGRSRRRVRLLTRFAAATERDAGHGIRRQLDAGSSGRRPSRRPARSGSCIRPAHRRVHLQSRPPEAITHASLGPPERAQFPGQLAATAPRRAQSVAHKQPGQTCLRYPTRLSKSVPSVALSADLERGVGVYRSILRRRTAESRLPRKGGNSAVTAEMLVAPAEQVSPDRSLASRCDGPGAAGRRLNQSLPAWLPFGAERGQSE